MHYVTAFDLAQSGYTSWWFALPGLVIGAVAARLAMQEDASPNTGVVAGFAALWVVIALGMTFSEYRTLRSALDSGAYRTVEGRVANFRPLDKMESFDVGSVHFAYYPYVVTSAFNRPFWSRDPIRDGLAVRIAYDAHGNILRLEIGQ